MNTFLESKLSSPAFQYIAQCNTVTVWMWISTKYIRPLEVSGSDQLTDNK